MRLAKITEQLIEQSSSLYTQKRMAKTMLFFFLEKINSGYNQQVLTN